MKLCPRTAPAPMAQRGGTGFPKACIHALGVPGSVPQVSSLGTQTISSVHKGFDL